MKVTISLEARFYRTPDQRVWTESVPDYSFWQRYLEVFDSVQVLARIQDVAEVPGSYRRTDGSGVSFVALPYYVGPYQYLRNASAVDAIVKRVARESGAVLLRIPGQVSNRLYRHLVGSGRPFAVEVVGDPYDVFAPGAVSHPLRPYFRWMYTRQVRSQCSSAVGAAYVTESALQQRYPNPGLMTSYSSIDIGKDAYVTESRESFGRDGVFRLVMVGSLAQLYKAPDILIDAVGLCVERGHRLTLKIIGDGKFRASLEEQAAAKGLEQSISFLGQLPAGAAVRNELVEADLFVLPSRTEGLPRVIIEAMACGLPCIGSNIGGIPELLEAGDLIPPGDVKALADAIEAVITNPARLRRMSARNLGKAQGFRNDLLAQRRRDFYRFLHDSTGDWSGGGRGRS
jgi:glycosyltransferase involved in cell wall biosynthesis